MQVLFDTDVVLKLAALDLLNEACEMLGAAPSEVCVPPGSVFMVRYDKRGRFAKRYGPGGVARAVAFLGGAATCEIDPERLAALNALAARADVEGLDRGEAELLAMASEADPCRLVSGDKRWPPAVQRNEPICIRVNSFLREQVVCFEQGVLRLIAHVGFASVRDAHLLYPHCDEALRLVFTADPASVAEAAVTDGLNSYVEALRAESGRLLVP